MQGSGFNSIYNINIPYHIIITSQTSRVWSQRQEHLIDTVYSDPDPHHMMVFHGRNVIVEEGKWVKGLDKEVILFADRRVTKP